ncbi:hypothetical protein JCM10207_005110 [Rhodosporidiobolus poonsookiae]
MHKVASAAWRTARLSNSSARPPVVLPAAVAVRNFSSSPAPSFFFRKPTKTPGELAKELLSAVKQDRLDLLHKTYLAYLDSLTSSPSSSKASLTNRRLSHDQLRKLMRYAAKTGRFQLVLRMFNDLTLAHHFTPTLADHHLLVLGMCASGRLDQARAWLVDLEATHGLRPSADEWNLVLHGLRRKKDLTGVRDAVRQMRSNGCEPDVVSYNTVISALFDEHKAEEAAKLVDEMRARGVQGDVVTETALLTGFLAAGDLRRADEVHARLQAQVDSVLEKGKRTGSVDVGAVNALVRYEAAQRGFATALRLARRYVDMGVELNVRTLNSLAADGARTVASAEEGVQLVEELEALVGVPAERHAWSAIIAALAEREGPEEALKLYQLARDRSVQPDSQMVQPLLYGYISPARSTPSDEVLPTLKYLYDDLAGSSKSFSTAPDAGLYTTLLRACADPAHRDLGWARALIADMKQRGVKLDGPLARWSIGTLMPAAQTWDEAFACYDELRALDPTVLDLEGYNGVLASLTSLAPPAAEGAPLPAPFVNEILSDMRISSHPPNSPTYTLLLAYYSRASPSNPSQGAATVAHLHSLVKLDANLDPDTALFNALLQAYSHTFAYPAAYRVWDALVANASSSSGASSGRPGPNATTLSVYLDTCGYDGSPGAQQRARRVWAEFDAASERGEAAPARLGFARTARHWETWVECLARWGAWGEVHEVLEGWMGGRERARGEVTSKAVETALKMAKSRDQAAYERLRTLVEGSGRPELVEIVERLEAGWTEDGTKAEQGAQ